MLKIAMEWIIYAQYFVNDKKSLRTVWILVEKTELNFDSPNIFSK